jgi:hypothetical protein
MQHAMSYMTQPMMEPPGVLAKEDFLVMAPTVLILMSAFNRHATLMRLVTTQLGHIYVCVNQGTPEMEQPV